MDANDFLKLSQLLNELLETLFQKDYVIIPKSQTLSTIKIHDKYEIDYNPNDLSAFSNLNNQIVFNIQPQVQEDYKRELQEAINRAKESGYEVEVKTDAYDHIQSVTIDGEPLNLNAQKWNSREKILDYLKYSLEPKEYSPESLEEQKAQLAFDDLQETIQKYREEGYSIERNFYNGNAILSINGNDYIYKENQHGCERARSWLETQIEKEKQQTEPIAQASSNMDLEADLEKAHKDPLGFMQENQSRMEEKLNEIDKQFESLSEGIKQETKAEKAYFDFTEKRIKDGKQDLSQLSPQTIAALKKRGDSLKEYVMGQRMDTLKTFQQELQRFGYECNIQDKDTFISIKTNGEIKNFNKNSVGVKEAVHYLARQNFVLKEATNNLMQAIELVTQKAPNIIKMQPLSEDGKVFQIVLPGIHQKHYDKNGQEIARTPLYPDITYPPIDLSKMDSIEMISIQTEITNRLMTLEEKHLLKPVPAQIVEQARKNNEKACAFWKETEVERNKSLEIAKNTIQQMEQC